MENGSGKDDEREKGIEDGKKGGELISTTTQSIISTGVATLRYGEFDAKEFERLRRMHNKEMNKNGNKKARREPEGRPDDVDGFRGPWARYEDDNNSKRSGPTAEERAQYLETMQSRMEKKAGEQQEEERTVLHRGRGDYTRNAREFGDDGQSLGRPPGSFECFAPRGEADGTATCIHSWTGHSKGVTSIEFAPASGHLLLSASQDTRCKVWDAFGERAVLRTFMGHSKAVREARFPESTAEQFASCGYDSTVRVWDTETGAVLYKSSLAAGVQPHCVRFAPAQSRLGPSSLLVGCSDKRVLQMDTRLPPGSTTTSDDTTSTRVEYVCGDVQDRKVPGAVNSITFLSSGHFCTAGDDRTVRVWAMEDYFGPGEDHPIPDPLITLTAPEAPVYSGGASMHPSGDALVLQGLDSALHVFNIRPNDSAASNSILAGTAPFHLQPARKRKFSGHQTGGFPCGASFSPDGKYLLSGDAKGFTAIWDWRSSQLISRFKSHSQVTSDVAWNPQESARFATASWDASIKYWQPA